MCTRENFHYIVPGYVCSVLHLLMLGKPNGGRGGGGGGPLNPGKRHVCDDGVYSQRCPCCS